jgi:hypothetical protein
MNVGMSYVKYECDIVTKYKVELLGWPVTIKFTNPSEISTVDDIRKLCQALKDGACKWVVQLQRQQEAHIKMITVREAIGESTVKKIKERSDKGKMRGQGSKKVRKKLGKDGGKCMRHDEIAGQEGGGDDENGEKQPPKKKRKTTSKTTASAAKKLPPAPKSCTFIDDSDKDSDED